MYGLAGHAGDWRQAQTDWQAQRLNTPLVSFESRRSTPGRSARRSRCSTVSNSRVRVLAVKKAEQSDEVIVRAVELDGQTGQERAVHVRRTAGRRARGERRRETPVGAATIAKGDLVDRLHAVPAADLRGEARCGAGRESRRPSRRR